MEILFRSIARAGGVEISPDLRICPVAPRKPSRLRLGVARGLAVLSRRLGEMAERLASDHRLAELACPDQPPRLEGKA